MKPILERGDDAEIPAAAPQTPKQIRMLRHADGQEIAVRGDYVCRDQVIGGQSVPPRQMTPAASERQPGDAGR
jgi:hypothetical protein